MNRLAGILILSLVSVFVSCTQRRLVGFYVYNKAIPTEVEAGHRHDDDYLELKKDGTFIFEAFYSRYLGGDIADERYSFVGTGSYKVLKDSLILQFDPNLHPDKSNKLLPPKFTETGYTIDSQPVTGRRVCKVSFQRDSVKVGNWIKLKR